ncbi:regulatory iron-sulfur-containing complex subunit RicT [Dinghuibacter silviterrae]|nr:regulatory iron-sulfur-containing complex subunit RicT [Dinghuibacter silviterrae]
MNVHDWLANLPFSDPGSSCSIVEISFNNGSRKDYYRNTTLHHFEKGDMVAVEGVSGYDVGSVSLTGELVRLQLKKRNIDERNPDIKKILRRAGEQDLAKWQENKKREPAAMIRSRAIARQLNLQMKVCEVEFQADGKKATFFYTADDRVDFRELIKVYASEFRVKVEMRQIGIRQEAAKVGGIGSCGRELCCSTWLTDFKSVNTTAARYQNLSINQTKLSGQCGRLKCCLNYELDTYLDALQGFPEGVETLIMAKGTATLVKKDIFRSLMWYTLPDSNKQYPLTIERVRQIQHLNHQGQRPEELQIAEVSVSKAKETEPEFVELVGHISLRSLERNSKRRKQKEREGRKENRREAKPETAGKPEAGPGGGARPDGGGARPDGGNRQGGRGEQRRSDQGRRPEGQGGGRPQEARKKEGAPERQGGGDRQGNPDRQGSERQGGHDRQGGDRQGQGGGERQGQGGGDRRNDQRGQDRRKGDRPQGDKPQGDRPQGDRSGGRPQQGGRPQGDRPQGERPQGERSQGDRPQGERPQSDRPQGERSQGDRSGGRQPQGEQPPKA